MLKKDEMVAEKLDVQIKQTRIWYNNDNVIIAISRQIKNPGIIRTVQGHSASNIQSNSGILRDIKAY